MSDERVVEQLAAWRGDILRGSGRRHTLLAFRHLKVASLEIVAPDIGAIHSRLVAEEAPFGFEIPQEPSGGDDIDGTVQAEKPKPSERSDGDPSSSTGGVDQSDQGVPTSGLLRTTKTKAADLNKSLAALARSSAEDFLDRGIWVLYLGLGMLNWTDEAIGGGEQSQSPLILVPVRLDRDGPRQPFRLTLESEEIRCNPVLGLRLEDQFGIQLPEADPDTDLESTLTAIRAALVGHPEWEIHRRCVMGRFSFQKEVIYRDLRDNAERVAAHPLVRALVLGQDADASLTTDPIPEEEIDDRAPPERFPTVLDADASQRQCIELAARGSSFVMDGPPGTGKSQTITNMIAASIGAGKRVLFVSEKAAALDVVAGRLKKAGLEEFTLRLQDQNVPKKAVAESLARSLTVLPRIASPLSSVDLATAEQRRRQLSDYALAVNEVRHPLGKSLFEVVGRVAALQPLPQAPLPSEIEESLEAGRLATLVEHAGTLARSWRPALEGDAFSWRGLDVSSVDAQLVQRLTTELATAQSALADIAARGGELGALLRVGPPQRLEEAERLVQIGRLLGDRPTVRPDWLTHDHPEELADIAGTRLVAKERHGEAATAASRLVGASWRDIDPEMVGQAVATVETVREVAPVLTLPDSATAAGIDALAAWCDHATGSLANLQNAVSDMAERIGMVISEPTAKRCQEVISVARVLTGARRPPSAWLNPAVLSEAEQARAKLSRAIDAVKEQQEKLGDLFEITVLELDVEGLVVRFRDVHHGFGKLRRSYREDKRHLAASTRSRTVTDEALTQLPEVATWKRLEADLAAAEHRHAAVLASCYEGVDTDFAAVDESIASMKALLSVLGHEAEFGILSRQLDQPDPGLWSDAQHLEECLEAWQQASGDVPSPLEVGDHALHELVDQFKGASPLLALVGGELRRLSRTAPDSLTVEQLADLDRQLSIIGDLERSFGDTADEDQRTFGASDGGEADWGAVARGLDWAARARAAIGTVPGMEVANALCQAVVDPDPLASAMEHWLEARDAFLTNFEESRRDELAQQFSGLIEGVTASIQAMGQRIADVHEWLAYQEARSRLEEAGLGDQVTFCIEGRLPAEIVAPVIERSVLERWADAVIRGDGRLGTLRAADRDAIVDEFRRLDEALTTHAVSQVAEGASARRPRQVIGAAAIIAREAHKKRRHMPVRTLLQQTAEVAQALKPCFLMTPLTVSQFLDPDLHFDTVIFDEASQVRPPDALGAIYRANQVIVAGDPKQLPPSSFWETALEDGSEEWEEGQVEDYESVLDLCSGRAGLTRTSLRWHYRSRHEDLIAFSNQYFYDGRLATFPSARPEGDDRGVALIHVPDGIYRRGSSRDNPVEAAMVVDRVLYHLRHNPRCSVGVVAFSEAQQSCIRDLLERRSDDDPELAAVNDRDRLGGLFVKNLENVQGDERDIIIFSVGYGRDEAGRFTLAFGPINKPGGTRRLNVAITRARQRVEVVSSVRARDFRDSGNEGVRVLRAYLDYAERGTEVLAMAVGDGGHDTESPFEEEVARVIRSWGYDVVPQVGVSGYRIDLGVRDPAAPGVYLLGVECDGARYHSSMVARDRDRLRHEVLTGLGWELHHIWGLSWYRDRSGAEVRLRQAIDAAHNHIDLPTEPPATRGPVVVEEDVNDGDGDPPWTVPYTPTRLWEIRRRAPEIDMGSIDAIPSLRELIRLVVDTESPVHESVVLRRVREGWGAGRAGARIKANVDAATNELIANGGVERDSAGFLRRTDHVVDIVRVPEEGRVNTFRSVSEVPFGELALAIIQTVREAHRIELGELYQHVARLFGWGRTGHEIVEHLEQAMSLAQERGGINVTDGWVTNNG